MSTYRIHGATGEWEVEIERRAGFAATPEKWW